MSVVALVAQRANNINLSIHILGLACCFILLAILVVRKAQSILWGEEFCCVLTHRLTFWPVVTGSYLPILFVSTQSITLENTSNCGSCVCLWGVFPADTTPVSIVSTTMACVFQWQPRLSREDAATSTPFAACWAVPPLILYVLFTGSDVHNTSLATGT